MQSTRQVRRTKDRAFLLIDTQIQRRRDERARTEREAFYTTTSMYVHAYTNQSSSVRKINVSVKSKSSWRIQKGWNVCVTVDKRVGEDHYGVVEVPILLFNHI